MPQLGGGTIAHPGDQSRQNRHAGQKTFPLDQPSDGEIEEDRRPFRTEPGACVKPADQPEVFGLRAEIAVAEIMLDLAGMFAVRG